jgi:hypothetical protein
MLVATALVLAWAGDRTFLIDEWPYLVQRSHWGVENLLRPTGGHLIAGGLILYNAAFSAFGADSHLPLTLITIGMQCLVAGLVYAYAARRLGAWIALLPALLVLFFGAGWEVLISSAALPNQVGMVSGIAMLLALDRRDRVGDVSACLMLAISLASFSIGLAFAVGAAVRIVLERSQRSDWRRLGIVVVPLALYVAWFAWALEYPQNNFSTYNIGSLAAGVFDQLNAALAGITGLFRVTGRPEVGDAVILDVSRTAGLVFLLAGAVGWRILRGPRLRPEAWATLGVVVAYLLLVGLGLNDVRRPDASRYAYMLTVLLMLAGADLLAGLRIARAWVYAAAVGLAVSLVANVAAIRTAGTFFEQESEYNRAELGALELARGTVGPSFIPEPEGPDFGVLPYRDLKFTAIQYFAAVDRFGSPAYPPEEIATAPEPARQAADELLVSALGLTVEPAPPLEENEGEPPGPLTVFNGRIVEKGACLRVSPDQPGLVYASVEVPTSGLAYYGESGRVDVNVGRFVDPPDVELPLAGSSGLIRIPPDASERPWRASFQFAGAMTSCSAPTRTAPRRQR